MVAAARIDTDGHWWHVGLVAALAAISRIPIWLSPVHLTFDEGVFLASTDLANAGLTQYRDFFTSQGPLFIPLLQLGNLIGFGDPRGARTVMVVSAMAIAVSVYYIAAARAGRWAGLALGVVAAVSGSVLEAAGPVQSEGPALALALVALAVVLWRDDRVGALAAGVLLGAALAVKSLHVIPTVLMVPAVLAARRQWLNVVYATLAGFVVAGGSALFYGVERVWGQYVLFHLAKDNTVNLAENLANLGRFLVELDPVVLVLALGAVALPRRLRPTHASDRSRMVPGWLGWVWLALTVVVVVGFAQIDAGFLRLVALFVPPLLTVVAGLGRIRVRFLMLAAVASVVLLALTMEYSHRPDEDSGAVVAALEDLPPSSAIVSDDPGLVWMAGRLSHPATVDPSYARFVTGYLVPEQVRAATAQPETCAFVSVSERFQTFGIGPPAQFRATDAEGVYIRPGC